MLKSILIKNNEIYSKTILILCFLLMSSAFLLAHNSPAVGYEPSIYTSTPIIIWIFLLVSITVGISIIISHIYFEKSQQSHLLRIGMLLVYLCYTFVLSLFIIRGYYSWCLNGDPATHIGIIYNILASGHLSNELYYPIIHIYATELSLIGGLDLIFLHKIIPLFFGILYVPFMYIFSKLVLQEKYQILMATLASCTFLNTWFLNFTPNILANLFFPLLLYCTFRLFYRGIVWEILILLMAFLYPLFHPVPTIALVLIVISLSLPSKIFIIFNKNRCDQKLFHLPIKHTLLLILVVWGITWISAFYVWNLTLISLKSAFIGGTSYFNELTHQINYAQGYGYNVTELVIKKLGGIFAYILIAFSCIPSILKRLMNNYETKSNLLFSLYGPIITIIMFTFFNYLFYSGFGPLRFVTYITLMATPFVGFYFTTTMAKFRQRKNLFIPSILILFMMGLFISGTLIVYPSPYDLEMSQQTTKGEFTGINWLFDQRNVDIPITGISVTPYTFVNMLSPSEIKRQKIPLWSVSKSLTLPSNHFGYNNSNSMLSTYYPDDVYLVILSKDKSIYVDVFPEMAKIRWTRDDFEKIDHDKSVEKIYSNLEFTLYYI